MKGRVGFQLWLGWIAANALAELVGLGLTFVLDSLIISRLAAAEGLLALVVGILLLTLTGAIEGSVVGLAQWVILRHPFPRLARHSWIGATVVRAMVAWFFGSLPSTLMDMGGNKAARPRSLRQRSCSCSQQRWAWFWA